MTRTVVLNVVGLTPGMLKAGAPNLARWAAAGATARIDPAFPARHLHRAIQLPDRRLSRKTRHRRQRLVLARRLPRSSSGSSRTGSCRRRRSGSTRESIDPSFTCANLFWWYNMYSTADYSVTPRPMYPADGRKIPDVYTAPGSLRDELQAKLGTFPLFSFWGPKAAIESTRWIAEAAKYVEEKFSPTLSLVYLPHLDYNLQRVGPGAAAAAADVLQVDELCGELIAFYEGARRSGRGPVGIRALRCHDDPCTSTESCARGDSLLSARNWDWTFSIPGASAAFAVADHQVAHVYVNDRSKLSQVREAIEGTPGVEHVLGGEGKAALHIDHPRAGDLVAIADARCVVHLLLLVRRRARAGLRAHRRHPPEARLRSGRTAARSGDSQSNTDGRLEAGEEKPRFPDAARRHPARRHAGQGIARPAGARGSGRGACFPHEADAPRAERTYRLDGGLRLVTSASGSD